MAASIGTADTAMKAAATTAIQLHRHPLPTYHNYQPLPARPAPQALLFHRRRETNGVGNTLISPDIGYITQISDGPSSRLLLRLGYDLHCTAQSSSP